MTTTEFELLQLRLKVAEAELAAANAKLAIGNAVSTAVTPAPVVATRERKPRAKKAKKEKVDPGIAFDVGTLVPLPDCYNTHVGSDTTFLFKVAYKAANGNISIRGVGGDEIKAKEGEEPHRKLWLRPLVNDGERMQIMTRKNFNFTKGFTVPAHGATHTGGEVLGMIPGSNISDEALISLLAYLEQKKLEKEQEKIAAAQDRAENPPF